MNKKKMWILFLLISFLGAANILSAENTERLSDICLGICGGSPNAFAEYNGKLYFSANDGVAGFELWVYDGVNPPEMVADIYPGSLGSNPRSFKIFQDKLYFSAQDVAHSAELWMVNGDNPPTLVADIWPGGYPSNPSYLTVFNNRLYFSAGDGRAHGYELFSYDGVNAPSLLADINQHTDPSGNSEGSFPTGLTVYNGKLYFQANDGNYGAELWEYDGVFPPQMVADIQTNPGMGSNPICFTEFNGELYFRAVENDGSNELWKYDGLNQPTRISFPQENPTPLNLTVFNNRLYFYAKDSTSGIELWSFDGLGTPSPVADINPGMSDSISLYSPSNMAVYSGRLFFQATEGVLGFELWSYDGTTVPQIISDIYAGTGSANPDYFYLFNNRLIFKADDGAYGKELWTYEQASVTVTAPNGEESWAVSSMQDIAWTTSGSIDNVKLEYSIDNGASWIVIIGTTENDSSYSWTIPDTASSQCFIKVSDANGIAFDVSDAVFGIINPTITVTAPNGGENWESGSAQNITWSSTGSIANVKIEYSIDSGSSWNSISASTANNGSFNWTVANSSSNSCLVKVSDVAGTAFDVSDAVFGIVNPTITVTAPNGGESWEGGSAQNISWSFTGTIANVKIEYSIDSGSSWNSIISSTANNGSFNWTVVNSPSSTCLIKVSDVASTATDISNSTFTIIAQKNITVIAPNGGESWRINAYQYILWNWTGAISNVNIEYSTNNGSTWIVIASSTVNTGSYRWKVTGPASTICKVKVSATTGSPSDSSNNVFRIRR
jgi:ELWxxDGT repeat protein